MTTKLRLPLDVSDICRLIPHRPPFLLIDRVLELEPGRSGVGIKVLAADDTVFAGHFPGYPIFPGVLLVEACAQLGAVVMAAGALDSAPPDGDQSVAPPDGRRVGYLASINRFKLLATVTPGDCLRLRVRIGRRVQSLVQIIAEASCGGRAVAAGEIAVTLGPVSDHSHPNGAIEGAS